MSTRDELAREFKADFIRNPEKYATPSPASADYITEGDWRRRKALWANPEFLTAAGEHASWLDGRSLDHWLAEVKEADPAAHERIAALMRTSMMSMNFSKLQRRLESSRQQVIEIVGAANYALLDHMTYENWWAGMNHRAPDMAVRLAARQRGFEESLDPQYDERRAHIDRMRQEWDWDAPLYPEIERGIPVGVKGFGAFVPRPGHPSIAAAAAAVSEWVVGQKEPMLTLMGAPGTGKTHLAQAAAAARAESLCFYRTEGKLFGEAMSRMQTRTTEELLGAVCAAPWLVLDDLGVTAMSDWGRGILDRLVDARYEHAQQRTGHTIITTNITGTDLQKTMPRLLRRLKEPGVSRVIQLQAPSYFARRSAGGDPRR